MVVTWVRRRAHRCISLALGCVEPRIFAEVVAVPLHPHRTFTPDPHRELGQFFVRMEFAVPSAGSLCRPLTDGATPWLERLKG